MMSVRRRLLLGTAVATTVIFLAATLSIYLLARRFLIRELDGALRAKARSVAALTDVADSLTHLEAEDAEQLPEFQPGSDPHYFQVIAQDGRSVAASPSLGDRRLNSSADGPRPPVGARFVRLPDGRPGRAVTVRARAQIDAEEAAIAPQIPLEITITVARSTSDLDRFLGRLRALLGSVFGAAMLILLGVTAWVIRRGLQPVRRIAGEIGGIGANELGDRLALTNVPAELLPIVSRLNDLLARLQAAFERERCFTSDAAHELRTPLAGISAALEVCSREKRDVERYDRVIRDCLKVTRQMQTVIENLLLLARADADRIPVSRAAVDLGTMINELWRRFEDAARHRRLSVDVALEPDLTITTDEHKLAIIIGNLLDNAVHYANESGLLRISAVRRDRSVTISIANTGSRVRPEDCQHVFDRFWRGDAARASDGRNCGLGLAVCRKLAEALGAVITVRSRGDGWFEVQLELHAGVLDAARDVDPNPVPAQAR